ncbi:hypothetical protein [Shewanella surugensis]|nr:hypothetical protein [Shewanella surugensis]
MCDGQVKVEEYATAIKVDIQDINAEQMKEIQELIAAVLGH